MAKAAIQNPAFTQDDKAREAFEAVRWPNGPVCPHCGNLDQEKIAKAQGKSARPGLYYCTACNDQFTVTVGTVMERSKISISKWLFAMHLMGSSKKGMSAHQIHRLLGVTYKSAWFMCHRIREAMQEDKPTRMGGESGEVQIDETYTGNTSKRAKSYNKGLKTNAPLWPLSILPLVACAPLMSRMWTPRLSADFWSSTRAARARSSPTKQKSTARSVANLPRMSACSTSTAGM
jgi:transposase-like protein